MFFVESRTSLALPLLVVAPALWLRTEHYGSSGSLSIAGAHCQSFMAL
jgi:hypothetical protein